MFSSFVLITDLRYATRRLIGSPLMTVSATLSLALGIAAVTTVFSLVSAVFIRPLPYRDSKRIVAIGMEQRDTRSAFTSVSRDVAAALAKANLGSFERLSFYRAASKMSVVADQPTRLRVAAIDKSFVELLLQPTLRGRWMSAEEFDHVMPRAVISEDLWRTRFGSDTSLTELRLEVDAVKHTVVGVLPPRFRFPDEAQVWLPLNPTDTGQMSVIAKLRQNASRDQAKSEVDAQSRWIGDIDRGYRDSKLVMREEMLDRGLRGGSFIAVLFLIAGTFVLVAASLNVGNLLLMRAARRRQEIAIRRSLGATTLAIMRQTFSETFLLAGLSGVTAVVLSFWFVQLALAVIPENTLPSWMALSLDWRVLTLVSVLVLTVTVATGMLPARLVGATNFSSLSTVSRSESRTHDLARVSRRVLVAQVAVGVALLVAATFVTTSYLRFSRTDVGYPADRIVVVSPFFDNARYRRASDRQQFAEAVRTRLTLSSRMQLVAVSGEFAFSMRPEVDRPDTTGELTYRRLMVGSDTMGLRGLRPAPRPLVVSDSYFSVFGLSLLDGRSFTERDREGSPAVAVVSNRLAQELAKSGRVLGQTLRFGIDGQQLTVVGIVGDRRDLYSGARGLSVIPWPDVYLTVRQALTNEPRILVRAEGSAATAMHAARVAVAREDPTMPLLTIGTVRSANEGTFRAMELVASLFGFFAIVTLTLGVMGVFGVVGYAVAQRTREIGIRMALGGSPSSILRLVTAGTVIRCAAGTLIGVALALLLRGGMRPFLFDGGQFPVLILLSAPIVFLLVAIFASYLPARRALAIQPSAALRQD